MQKDDRTFLDTSENHSGGINEDKALISNSLFKALHSIRQDRKLVTEVLDKSYTHSQSGIIYQSRIAIMGDDP